MQDYSKSAGFGSIPLSNGDQWGQNKATMSDSVTYLHESSVRHMGPSTQVNEITTAIQCDRRAIRDCVNHSEFEWIAGKHGASEGPVHWQHIEAGLRFHLASAQLNMI